MSRTSGLLSLLILVFTLTACAGMSSGSYEVTSCSTSPGGYECQIEMDKKAL